MFNIFCQVTHDAGSIESEATSTSFADKSKSPAGINPASSTNMPLDIADCVAAINTISPIPKSKIERKRKTKVEGSSLLTGSPFKNHLLEQAARKVSDQRKIGRSTQSEKKLKTGKGKGRKTNVEGSSLLTGFPFKNHLLEQAPRKVSDQRKIDRSTQSEKKLKTGKGKGNSMKDPVLQSNEKKPYKKKLTCRLDKPRGPASKKVKSRGGKNLQRSIYDSNHNTDAECIICGETFCSSKPHEQWIQCKKCKGWCHIECSGGETSTGFVCDFCC